METENKTRRHVITGGPCTGKSTIIALLKAQGYSTVPEAARTVIERASAEGTDCLPWKNVKKFQQVVSQLQLLLENSILEGDIFSDRGIVDGLAYSRLDNIEPPTLIDTYGKNRYKNIFLLDPLPLYQTDGCRFEDRERALLIQCEIGKAYHEFGYSPISVPFLAPQERVEFILNHLKGGQI